MKSYWSTFLSGFFPIRQTVQFSIVVSVLARKRPRRVNTKFCSCSINIYPLNEMCRSMSLQTQQNCNSIGIYFMTQNRIYFFLLPFLFHTNYPCGLFFSLLFIKTAEDPFLFNALHSVTIHVLSRHRFPAARSFSLGLSFPAQCQCVPTRATTQHPSHPSACTWRLHFGRQTLGLLSCW